MKKLTTKLMLLSLGLANITSFYAQTKHQLNLDTKATSIKIQPTMYGIFFEDINNGADGGLYAELIKNRSFEFATPLMGWSQPNTDRHSENKNSGEATIINLKEKSNSNYARISINHDAGYSIINEGFKGIGLHQGAKYDFSFNLQKVSGQVSAVKADLLDENDQIVSSSSIQIAGNDWKKYTVEIVSSKTVEKAKLRLTFKGNGVVNMDMISLFPQDTWKGRKGGLRKDLVQKLDNLKPGFLRFPGGCIVEGRTLAERYQWKKTIGKAEDREFLVNRWNTEFAHRPSPDYYQSFGLGFFEYFQLSEDLGAEALPILSCGIACQFNTGELVHMEDIDPYVKDALDLIEFANGDAKTTAWGRVRADMGHPQPFNLKYIGVGNEQWGPDYIERYKIFEKAIHAKYPKIQIISGSGPFDKGEYFDYGWQQLKELKAEIVDEHYYSSAEWFKQNATRYDNYDRKGPKVFAGEYAVQSVAIASPENKNNWDGALAEAAFMTGLERNAEVVHMTSYAPLFAHAEGWQWTPDLIWFNNLGSYATPNYYVQQLFSLNKGTDLLKIQENGKDLTGQNNLYASAVYDDKTKEYVVKLVNTYTQNKQVEITSPQKIGASKITKTTLSSTNLKDENNFNQELVKPKTEVVNIKKGNVSTEISSNSVVILRFK